MKSGWLYTAIAVFCIVSLAWFLRTYDITSYPPGLFPDEAANGEDVLLILQGDTQPFYPRNNGREALFFYLQAALVKVFGIGVWQMHMASAIVGTLTVFAIYFATKPYFGRLSGVLAALFLATSSWHLALSRTGFRAILIPLVLALFTAFVGLLISAVKEKRFAASYVYAALAGLSFGSGFYTYIAYRSMIGVVLGIVILLLLAAMHPKIGFPHARRYGFQTLFGVLLSIVALLPLGMYFMEHPNDFIGRAGQVSVFNKDLQREVGGGTLVGTVLYSFEKTALSFFYKGDTNWRHNVSGYPLLNPLVGLLAILGICWAIKGTWDVFRQIVRGKEVHMGMVYPYLLLLLLGMMLPSVTTAEGMPHALRSIGMITPLYILAGTAGAVALRWMLARLGGRSFSGLVYGGAAGLLIISSAYGPLLYFMISRNSPDAAEAYRGDLTVVANFIIKYAEANPSGPKPYLVLDEFSDQTVHYLSSTFEGNDRYVRLHPEEAEETLVRPGEVIIFTQSTISDANEYEVAHRSSIDLVDSQHNRFGQEVMRVYIGKSDDTVEEFDLDA